MTNQREGGAGSIDINNTFIRLPECINVLFSDFYLFERRKT